MHGEMIKKQNATWAMLLSDDNEKIYRSEFIKFLVYIS